MSKLRGRFDGPTSDEMQRFSSSLRADLRMLDEDIEGSRAHATMLGECGVIAPEEAGQLCRGLDRVREEIRSGDFRPGEEHDDIHMAVEFRLGELLGPVAGKLHTARSRNDQVATDVRLWLKRRLVEIDAALGELAATLLDRIESDGRTLIPGYTHLQRGQPIWLGHHLLAHVGALVRDRSRFAEAVTRIDRSPLGACAMAGTSHPIDRERTAALLGFDGVVENAMDAVAGRDHEHEVAACCAIAMTHLSRMAEELVLWSAAEFDLVRLSDSFATGSSIMPQKRNPDAAELVRGKASRVHGHLVTLLGTVKSLPLAYNRDLQESREPLFDSVETCLSSFRIMQGMWRTLEIRTERFATELEGDSSLATELADLLVGKSVPFREAHEIVGSIVRRCEEQGRSLIDLDREALRGFHPELQLELKTFLDPQAVAERKTSRGGTAWTEVERQVAQLRETLGGES